MAGAWATTGAERAGTPGGGASPYQGGGRARPTLSGGVGSHDLQVLAVSSGTFSDLRSSASSLSLGVHHPRPRTTSTSLAILSIVLVDYSRCISYMMS